MTLEELNLELKTLIGETVSFKRIVGNMILIYFFDKLGDGSGVYFLISPPWRYQQYGEIVFGSDDFPSSEDFLSPVEYQEEFRRSCSLTNDLRGARLEDFEVDLKTSDLQLKFSDGQIVRKFTNSVFDDASSSINIRQRHLAIHFTSSGIKLNTELRERPLPDMPSDGQ